MLDVENSIVWNNCLHIELFSLYHLKFSKWLSPMLWDNVCFYYRRTESKFLVQNYINTISICTSKKHAGWFWKTRTKYIATFFVLWYHTLLTSNLSIHTHTQYTHTHTTNTHIHVHILLFSFFRENLTNNILHNRQILNHILISTYILPLT